MKKLFIVLTSAVLILTACGDYGGRNFVYPTPLPVILSGTPIAVLIPTPAPTATPQPTPTVVPTATPIPPVNTATPIPPVNTATPQPTATPSKVSQLGESFGSTTSTSATDTDVDLGAVMGTNSVIRVTVSVECYTANCGAVSFQNATNGNSICADMFANPLLADTRYNGVCIIYRSNIATGLWKSDFDFVVEAGAGGHVGQAFSQGINWTDNWDLRMHRTGVTSGATLHWHFNIERIG